MRRARPAPASKTTGRTSSKETSVERPSADRARAEGKTADLLLRGVDRELIDVFKSRAARHGRSLQAELQQSLVREAHRNFDEALEVSRRWHAKLGGRAITSAKSSIAEDRRR